MHADSPHKQEATTASRSVCSADLNRPGFVGGSRPEKSPGKPTTRRYTEEEKAQAVRLVRQLRRELGTEHGRVCRVIG